ncbi:FAD:protein FMN transferase [Staphylococcus felis]|nr:FAD:protein FMN transferase [Staphylococcus felis]
MLLESRQFKAMGTCITLSILDQHASSLLNIAENKIKYWEKRFSANDNNSELMTVNRNAGLAPVRVQSDLFDLIQFALNVTIASSLKMNILIGPLVKLWKIGFDGAHLPPSDQIKSRLNLIHPNDVILNPQNNEVYLTRPGMEIDLGAIAKGYFADQLQQLFIQHGVVSGVINLGGNVMTIGRPSYEQEYWHIGIRNPFESTDKPLLILKVKNKSVVTSGIYERFFEHKNVIYHHILDSQTGYPANNDIASVTIVSNHSIDGEIWSTICSFGTAQQNISILSQVDGIEGLIITRQRQILYTPHLKNKIIF